MLCGLFCFLVSLQKVKEFTSKIEALKAAKISAESRRAGEEVAESPVAKLGGFQDFTVPSKAGGRKKRHLPIAPRRRDTGSSQDDQEGKYGFLWYNTQVTSTPLSSHTHTHELDDMFLGTTPANRPDSPEFGGTRQPQFAANYRSFHEEQLQEEAAVEEDEGEMER